MRLRYTGPYPLCGLDADRTKHLSAEDLVTIHVADRSRSHEDPHRELAARCDALEALVGRLMARLPESEWLEIAPQYYWVKP